MEDKEQIRKIIEGDRAAFSGLVSRYQNYVYTICMRILRNPEIAEEAAQDTFVKVFRTIKTFREDAKFSTWLYSIAYRTAIDHSRKKKLPISSIDKENFPNIKDKAKTPLEITADQNLKQVLEKLIQRLPPKDAGIISLYYQGELSVKEIAKNLELSESNVKVRLFRVREVLKTKLSRYLRAEVKDLL